jgi:transcriptional regulator with XRE-family HTH domain
VRRLRKDHDWSQERLAAEAGDLRQGLMSDIELGKANPTLTTLESIAGALDVSVGELFASPAVRRR